MAGELEARAGESGDDGRICVVEREDGDHRPLRLAAGDRHGRIAIWDARTRVVVQLLVRIVPARCADREESSVVFFFLFFRIFIF